ncbi:MAG: DUF995 domain-containing protein [Phyllobacterium sp.]|uniref:DUF995 domain-containing protein n=1 Tax=Phyllobacterium sp. TaxID=1871046 RepID=UPI0030F25CEF
MNYLRFARVVKAPSCGTIGRSSIWIAALLSAAMLTGSARASEAITPSADARPMSAVELYLLYRDKTWTWPDGAGRFDDQERRFTARTGAGATTAWAQGRWVITNDGLLCLDADWHTLSGIYRNNSCFGHMRDHETIFQRKEPSGAWYVFKHAVPTKTDEFNKLVADNLVSSDLASIKSDLEDQKRLAGNKKPGKRTTQ